MNNSLKTVLLLGLLSGILLAIGEMIGGASGLVTAFAFAFLATAALGHVLLLQAAFAPSNNPKSGKAAQRPSGRAPITGAGIAT